jgi:MFS transporter, DHA1 family, inner membrane transport protein
MSSKEKILLLLLASINFTHILDFMIMMPLGNYLMPYFHISPQEFSVLVSSYTISAAISSFISAFYVDGFDRKKVLLVGYIGFIIGTIACGIAPTFALLLTARIIAGLFGGLIGAQVLSIVSDTFAYERRGRAMGAVMSAFSLASTFGVPFALYLANLSSWHAPFLLVGALGILVIPFVIRYVPNVTRHIHEKNVHDNKWTVITQVLSDKNQYLALIFSGFVIFGHFLIIPFINPYMEFNLGFSKNITPLIYLVGGITSFFSANILGRISDEYGKLRIFSICVFIALPLIIAITNMPPIHFGWILACFGLWFFVATGRGITAQAMVSNVVPPEQRGSFQSFNSSIQQLGTGIASLLAGYIVVKTPSGDIENFNIVGFISMAVLSSCILIGNIIFKNIDKKNTDAKTKELVA